MRLRQLLTAVTLATLPLGTLAQQAPVPTQQQPPSPEQTKAKMQANMEASMQATMGAMVSAVGPMTDAVIEAQLSSAAKVETAERIATFKRNLYDALGRSQRSSNTFLTT